MNITKRACVTLSLLAIAMISLPSQADAQRSGLSRLGRSLGIGTSNQGRSGLSINLGGSSGRNTGGSGNINSGSGEMRQGYSMEAPNQSGGSNSGGFDMSSFFGQNGLQGRGGTVPHQPTYPRTPSYPNSTYPNSTYPNTAYPSTTYPNTSYPSTSYPSNTTYPNSTHPQRSYPQTTYPQSNYPSPSYPTTSGVQSYQRPSPPTSANPRYPDPPIAPKVSSKLPIQIRCPEWCEGECHYDLINASEKVYHYSIRGGSTQTFSEGRGWRIRYSEGSGLSSKTFNLRGGKTYELRRDGTGPWQFYMVP